MHGKHGLFWILVRVLYHYFVFSGVKNRRDSGLRQNDETIALWLT